jgi:hypothetical protein
MPQSTFTSSSSIVNKRHPITKEVIRQLKRPHHISIVDRLVILPIDALTSVNYRPQPKTTRLWHELWTTGSATIVDKKVTIGLSFTGHPAKHRRPRLHSSKIFSRSVTKSKIIDSQQRGNALSECHVHFRSYIFFS